MVNPIQIENLPEEVGEEIALNNHDDGTISSKILGSTAGQDVLRAMEAKNEAESENEGEQEAEPDDMETEEREFDKNPTVLYALVQKKLWKEATARAKSNPKEARAFISRREKDGRIRWRLLPLHAAIVFKAPEEVIEVLLISYPKAAEEKDDQGMLPLHLAFRNSASAEAINLLLLAYPDSVDIPDRKGRVPLTLAKAAASPNRELYIKALEKGPSHYSVTALASARDRIIAEQKVIFDSQLNETLKFHESAMSEMDANAEKKQKEIAETLLEKEKELVKLHENSQVLVDHVASLEAQMNTRTDTERFLATKIAKLEEKVRVGEANLQEREDFWENEVAELKEEMQKNTDSAAEDKTDASIEKTKLNATIEGLTTELEETKTTLDSTIAKLSESIESMKEKQDEWDMKEIRSDAKYAKVEIDWANSQANIAILESQLKKRMENEHLLAAQVSSLASRLSESANGNMKNSREIKEFRDQKSTLETTVRLLKERLNNVTTVMETTREKQMSILDDAIAQEETMAKCMESHAQMVSDSLLLEKEMQSSKDQLMELIEKSFDEANEKRIARLNIATTHGQSLSSMNTSRHNVLSCAQTVTSNVISALEKDLNMDTLSDEVFKAEVEKRGFPKDVEDLEAEVLEREAAMKAAIEEASSRKEEETPTPEEPTPEPQEETAAIEVSTEEPTPEPQEEAAAIEVSTEPIVESDDCVEVVVSPKKSLASVVVVDPAEPEVEEEQRAEMDEPATTVEVQSERVSAE